MRSNIQRAGVKFKHILTPGRPQLGGKPETSPVHIQAAPRAKFSTTEVLWKSSQWNGSSSPQGKRGKLGKITVGVALGLSTVVLAQSLHTGTLAAMALKVNLNSSEGDWKITKGETIQQSPRIFNVHS